MATAADKLNLDTARQDYHDNADWDSPFNLVKARAFATACRRLIGMLPEQSSRGSESLRFNLPVLQAQLAEVKKSLRFYGHNPVTALDYGCFRE